MGEFQNGSFEGLGRKCFENGDIWDGLWKDGKMFDVGVVFDERNNSYILGCFFEDEPQNIYHKGEDFPHLLISNFFFPEYFKKF